MRKLSVNNMDEFFVRFILLLIGFDIGINVILFSMGFIADALGSYIGSY